MNESFVKSIYETVINDSLQSYKGLYETTDMPPGTIRYWKQASGLYNSLNDENKEILMKIVEQTMIDTVSHMLGVIDGSSTLNDCPLEPKLLLDCNDTEGELQDLFLQFIDERECR